MLRTDNCNCLLNGNRFSFREEVIDDDLHGELSNRDVRHVDSVPRVV